MRENEGDQRKEEEKERKQASLVFTDVGVEERAYIPGCNATTGSGNKAAMASSSTTGAIESRDIFRFVLFCCFTSDLSDGRPPNAKFHNDDG